MSKTTKGIIIALSVVLAIMVMVIVMLFLRAATTTPSRSDPVIDTTPAPQAETIEVRSVTMQLESTEVLRGARIYPEVIIHPENATDKDYEIHSDNERIIRAQGHHWVAVEIGTASLIATAKNGIVGMVTVTVIAPELESISFFEEEITINLGDTVWLSPVYTPEDARRGEPIQYSSDNNLVVTVTEYGRVTAVGDGTTTVRGTIGEISAELEVTVKIPVRHINITMDRRIYSVGDEAEFKTQVVPANATNAALTVDFSGASVTSTGENSFICNAAGEVTVTFTAESGASASLTITVYDLDVLASEVHRLTNNERANAGLSTLGGNYQLTQTALVRAKEIIIYFSHTRPDGRDCFTAFNENGVEYRHAGENLAAGQRTAAEVVDSWMRSTDGHREAILNPDFGLLGVGVTMDDDGRIYWAQAFTD